MPDPAGDAVDRVNAFIEKALDWMDAHLDEFDPFAGGRPFEIRLGQRVGELAILLHAYVKLTGRSGDPRALRMASLLERIQSRPEFVARLIRSPLEFILFAEVYANLRAVGRDDDKMHALIQRVLDAGFLEQTERFPNRMMDIRACLDMGAFDTDYPSLPALYGRSILGGRLDPLLLSQDDLYAITHVLMFLYGFGTRHDLAVPERSLADLESLLPGLLVLVAQEHHWDLMAELLICWECIHLPPTKISEGAWAELEALQDPNGAVPGPEWAAQLHAGLGRPSGVSPESDSYFSHHYHTTLVSLIAACLRLRRLEAAALPRPAKPKSRAGARSVDVPRRLAAAHGARSWLGHLAAEVLSDRDARADLLGQLLLGQWTAAALAGEPVETVAHEIRQIGERLAEHDHSNTVTWSHASATQLLLVALLLDREEIVVPYLHAPDGFVNRVVVALEATNDPALDEPRALLQNAGRLPESPLPDPQSIAASVGGLRLGADAAEIDSLLDRVEAHTAFGTRRSHLGTDDAWIAELLAGVAVYSLRRYDFVRGTRLIRAVRALEPLSPTSRDLLAPCVNFVYLNQRPEGAFGFVAPEARALEAAGREGDAEPTLALPVTVNCLWALAEAETDWRLFGSI